MKIRIGLAALTVLGCGSDLPDLGDELFAELSAEAVDVARQAPTPACHQHAHAEPADTALVVGTNLCLSCASVGALLRDRIRSGRRDVLVVASADAEDVCRFLTAEKARMPVLAVEGSEFGRATWLNQILMADLKTGDWTAVAVSEDDVGSIDPITEER